MNPKNIEKKRYHLHNKIITSVDPAKRNPHAMIITESGIPYYKSFNFDNTFKGFKEEQWLMDYKFWFK